MQRKHLAICLFGFAIGRAAVVLYSLVPLAIIAGTAYLISYWKV